MNLLNIIKNTQTLSLLANPDLIDIDGFPGGGIGGGDTGGGSGGSGGVVTGIVVPGLSMTPNADQSIAIGTKLCFRASGATSLPSEPERAINFDIGCDTSNNGTWIKTCGVNGGFDSHTTSSTIINRKQPFYIQCKNSVFSTPGSPTNNFHMLFGVKTTNGYYFIWEIYKYCNATAGNCSSPWLANIKMIYPDGSIETLTSGLIEFNQTFRLKSDGNRIIWEYTTYGNWAYNHFYMTIPEDCGNFIPHINGGWNGNRLTNLVIYKGSYQGTTPPEDFIWTSSCPSNLEVTGDTACFTPTIPGSCTVCVSTLQEDPICSNIVSSYLYLTPNGINCDSCGEVGDCLNIPEPTTPIITANVVISDISVTWTDSISFTTGLIYELDVNGVITELLDSSVLLTGLADGIYNIRVRAVDDCGQSAWSNIEIVEVDTGAIPPAGALDFLLTGSLIKPITYDASWSSIPGMVEYEIWIGNPQSKLLLTTTSTTEFLGTLISGLSLSVRGHDGAGNYSDFSNIEIVP